MSHSHLAALRQIEFIVKSESCQHLPLHLGGISMGGAIALSAARYLCLSNLQPRQLVLVAPAGFEPFSLFFVCVVLWFLV